MNETPQMRLRKSGPAALSTAELLAVIMNDERIETAVRLIDDVGERLPAASWHELIATHGVNVRQAAAVAAAGELGRRWSQPPQREMTLVYTAVQAAAIIQPQIGHLEREELWILMVDNYAQLIAAVAISAGGNDWTRVYSRDVFRPAIRAGAAGIWLAHNHPSGWLTPSQEDVDITARIVQAGKILGISVLDHIVVTRESWLSLATGELMP